jgi:outer membrane protein assembly factor BamB
MIVVATPYNVAVVQPWDGHEKWSKTISQQITRPLAIAGGLVYVVHSQRLTALDLAAGGAAGQDSDAGSEITAVSGFGERLAVYATADNRVCCVEGVTLKWSMKTVGVVSVFAFDDAQLYIGDDKGYIYALNDTGVEAWRQGFFGRSIRCLLTIPDSIIYADANGNVACVTAATGTPVWSVTTTTKSACTTVSAVPDGNHILITDTTGRIYKLGTQTRKIVWEKDVAGSDRSAPVATDRLVYAGTNAGTLAVLDLMTGELIRSVQLGRGRQTFVAGYVDAVLVTDDAGFLQALIP